MANKDVGQKNLLYQVLSKHLFLLFIIILDEALHALLPRNPRNHPPTNTHAPPPYTGIVYLFCTFLYI